MGIGGSVGGTGVKIWAGRPPLLRALVIIIGFGVAADYF